MPLAHGVEPLGGRTWPMALAPSADGTWWAIVKYDMMTLGTLVRLDAQGRFDRAANVPKGSDFTAATRLGNGLIAADYAGPALQRMELDGSNAGPFGSDDFQAEMHAQASEIARWGRWQAWARGALIGAPLLGLVLLLAMGERAASPGDFAVQRPPRPAAHHRTELDAEPVMIGIAEAHRRRVLWLASLRLGTTALAIGVPLFLMPSHLSWPMVAGLAMIGAVGIGHLVWSERLGLTTRLVVEAGRLRLERAGKNIAEAALSDCFTDGRSLLIDGHRVLVHARQPIFDAEPLRDLVLAHIPPTHWLGSIKLEWLSMRVYAKRRPWTATFVVVGVVVALVAGLTSRRF